MIVNETLARSLWPGQDALGKMVTQDGGRRVIGVVGNVHHGGPERSGGSEMYLPMRQTLGYATMKLVVRTTLPTANLAAGLREALRPLDPNLPVTEFQSLQNLVDKVVSPRRFLVMLLSGFAGFVTRFAGGLPADLLLRESAHKGNWNTSGLGGKPMVGATRGSRKNTVARGRRGRVGNSRVICNKQVDYVSTFWDDSD